MRSIVALLLLSLVSCETGRLTPVPASDPALADINTFVERALRTLPEVPSVGLAIVHDGKRYARGFGLADVERNVPATAATGYYVGSFTKAFTGLAAAILAERGLIDFDAPITTYLPELRFASDIDASRITLRRLMSHSAPIANNAVVFRTAYSGDHTPARLIEILRGSTSRKEVFEYDNLGYVIASLVMERVTGKPWQQLHDELVFTPLGMTRSTGSMSEAVRTAMAEPYDLTQLGRMEVLSFRKNDQMMHAAGGTVMTAEDLSRWLAASLSRGALDGRQIIPAAAFGETQRQQATLEKPHSTFGGTTYGFGWYTGRLEEEAILYHGGGFEGWRTLFTVMPARKLAVGVMTNSDVGHHAAELIANYVYARLLGQPDADVVYGERLKKLRTHLDGYTARVVEGAKKRATLKSQLARDAGTYVGRYENALMGMMTITERDGRLFASIGGLHAPLEPHAEPETARVELIPGNGDAIRFGPSGARGATTLAYADEVFTRIE